MTSSGRPGSVRARWRAAGAAVHRGVASGREHGVRRPPRGQRSSDRASDHAGEPNRRAGAAQPPRGDRALRALDCSVVPESPLPPLQMAEVQRAVARRAGPDRAGHRRARRAFEAAGHELALVGGPVRDAMLGRRHNDLDFTTSARPEETERILKRWGDAYWDMGRDFGTIGCRKGDWVVEVTTYRSEAYDPDLPQARRRLRRLARRRPGSPRLHRQRDGGAAAEPRVRGPVRRRASTSPTGCSARRAGRRTPSPTTRCG